MADSAAPFRIKGESGEWEVVIGLEVHAQVVSNAKLFSGAATAFGAEPNTQVSLVDAAMPGMLPVPNRECIRQAVRTGSMPGIAASTSETFAFGSAPNFVEAPEKSFASEVIWACTSSPITTSHAPVAPSRR